MAEEIKVVLEADASQLTGEFRKAQQTAEAFARKTLPLTTAEMNRLYVEQTRVNKALNQGRGAYGGAGQGLLQLAQFADDAQYGIRGIMNNIPGLLMGLGAGAGLAGVASIAALALFGLHKGLKAVTGVANAEGFDKAMDAAAKAGQELTDSLQRQNAERRNAEVVQARMAARLEAERTAMASLIVMESARTRELDRQEKSAERRRRIDDQIRTARQSIATGPQAEFSNAAENRRVAALRLEEDLRAAYDRSADASAAYNRIIRETGNSLSEKRRQLATLNNELRALEDRNAFTQNALKTAEDGLKNAPTGRGTGRLRENAQENLNIVRQRNAAEQERITTLRAEIDLQNQLFQELLARAEQEGEIALQSAAAAREKITSLREEKNLQEQLAAIEKERAAATEEARLNRDLEERRASMAEARRRYEDEQIMKGNGSAAIDPQAQLDRRRRIAIERVTALMNAERTPGGIRRARPMRGLQGGGLDSSPRGLGPETRRRFGREDRVAEQSSAAKAAAYYVKALENDERLIKAFERLGIL